MKAIDTSPGETSTVRKLLINFTCPREESAANIRICREIHEQLQLFGFQLNRASVG